MFPYMDSDVTTFNDYSVIANNVSAAFIMAVALFWVFVMFPFAFMPVLLSSSITFWISSCIFCSV